MNNLQNFYRLIVHLLIILLFIMGFYVLIQRKQVQKEIKDKPATSTIESVQTPTSVLGTFYTVKKGDTLWDIAEKIYGDGFYWVEIAQVNNIANRSNLKVGTRLVLPSANDVQGLDKKNEIVKSSPTPITSPTTPIVEMSYPSQVINLTNWKLTLPIGLSEDPTEIKQPELASYRIDPWFVAMADGGVRFRAPVNGVTTGGSNYPRSELREMTNNGEEKASWSSDSGVHTMFLDQTITAVPAKKKHVVAGQIHDEKDDVIVIRLEYPVLYVNVDGKNVHELDSQYTLGKRFTIQFVVEGNKTKVYYNNSTDPVYTLNKSYSEAYFKTGAYTQSNCKREDSSSLCNENNFGEVIVYQAIVTHQ